jgi:hypothetical protein
MPLELECLSGEIIGAAIEVRSLEDVHFVVVRSYLRAVGRQHGLLLNFAKSTLEAKRVLMRHDRQPSPGSMGSSETPS